MTVSRRRFLAMAAVFAGGAATGCKKAKGASSLVCTDTQGLAAPDVQARTALHYADHTPQPGKSCAGCQQFEQTSDDKCGTCKVLKGPINPEGYCSAFTPRPT